ncbi:uncharacterized protein LOC128963095 isoform X2 [Oppia nitens]|uniref:uncharacterized protein LOC128963095 isoform X2 n=1 Tax=Oppia nitens TaxID=1686743 RepID=UPI0023DA7FFA|nr:uncharacterized protein LOC128963095 isoform X2 [Oppia nitens]
MAAKYVEKMDPMDEIKSVLNDLNELNEEVIEFKGTDRNMKYRLINDMLSRCMTRLYTIDTDGGNDDGVRMSRRAAVVAVQKCIDLLDKKLDENTKRQKLSITDGNDKPIAEISTTGPIAVAIEKNIFQLSECDINKNKAIILNDKLNNQSKLGITENNDKPIDMLSIIEPIDVIINKNATKLNKQIDEIVIKLEKFDHQENKSEITMLLLVCLIPAKFTLTDWETGESKVCTFGSPSDTENTEITSESATQYPRCYTFDFGDYRLNIIDTPGIADTKGLDKDNRNMQNILNFISNYNTINGICVLLKPNEAKVNVIFKYCILELLSHLNKSAADNIMFVFTNARSTFYAPGDTTVALKDVLNKVGQYPPYVNIKFDKTNTFCFDNESFRYLVAVSQPNNIKFNENIQNLFETSWDRSVNECLRMMRYIFDVKPHNVRDTLSINETKRTIKLLTQPLADITENIADNIKKCQIQTEKILQFRGNIEELKRELYIPVVEIESKPLDHPMTVCSDNNCCELMNINGQVVKHYRQVCHNKCYLEYDDGNVVGNEGLLDCQAFNEYKLIRTKFIKPENAKLYPDQNKTITVDPETGLMKVNKSKRIKYDNCQQCGHSYETHLHIKYKTRKVESKRRDESKYNMLNNNKKAIKAQKEIVEELTDRQLEYENETKIITDCMAKFAAFLKLNAMTPFNDAFEDYVKHLIRVEEYNISLVPGESRQSVDQLKSILKQYQHERDIILKSMIKGVNYCTVNLEDIDNCLNNLYKLPINGHKIQELLNMQLIICDKIHTNLQQQQHVIKVPVNSSNIIVKLGKSVYKAIKRKILL